MTRFHVAMMKGGKPKEEPVVTGAALRIGRLQYDNDLVLDEESVAPHHAALALEEGALVLTDLGSATGIYIDGQPAGRRSVLASGAKVTIGAFDLDVRGDGSEDVQVRIDPLAGMSLKKLARTIEPAEGLRRAVRWYLGLAVIGLGLGFLTYKGLAHDHGLYRPGDAAYHDALTAGPGRKLPGCGDCHRPFGGVADQSCNRCHGPTQQRSERGPHAAAVLAREGAEPAGCGDCHLEHPRPEIGHVRGFLPPGTCETCHAPAKHASCEDSLARTGPAPTVALSVPYPPFSHRAHMKDRCEACHRSHEGPGTEPLAGRDFPVQTYAECIACHREPRFQAPRHGFAAYCGRCHPRPATAEISALERRVVRLGPVEPRPVPNALEGAECRACHLAGQVAAVPDARAQRFRHASHVRDLPLELGGTFKATEACLGCHRRVASADRLDAGPVTIDELSTSCERCHGPLRVVETAVREQRGLAFDHEAHQKIEGSCGACHLLRRETAGEVERMLTPERVRACLPCHVGHKDSGLAGCQACHGPELFAAPAATPVRGPSGFRHATRDHDIVGCVDCHRGSDQADKLAGVFSPAATDEGCGRCHAGGSEHLRNGWEGSCLGCHRYH